VRRRRQQHTIVRRGAGGLAAAISRHPRESVGVLTGTVAVFVIFVNALFLQHGPHPAPIFATRPVPVPHRSVVLPPPRAAALAPAREAPVLTRTQMITDIQRELARRGFYDGTADGIWGAKTDAAVRDFVQASGQKINPDASESLLRAITSSTVKAQGTAVAVEPVRNDPIAQLIAPSRRVVAVQRALADFGYGQIKPSGVEDPETQIAVEKFERDHGLPVTGRISDRFVRELAAMTGRPLE
jgi:peptidoglycan hydrolase-like protein with peptidoglycan-binding domain